MPLDLRTLGSQIKYEGLYVSSAPRPVSSPSIRGPTTGQRGHCHPKCSADLDQRHRSRSKRRLCTNPRLTPTESRLARVHRRLSRDQKHTQNARVPVETLVKMRLPRTPVPDPQEARKPLLGSAPSIGYTVRTNTPGQGSPTLTLELRKITSPESLLIHAPKSLDVDATRS